MIIMKSILLMSLLIVSSFTVIQIEAETSTNAIPPSHPTPRSNPTPPFNPTPTLPSKPTPTPPSNLSPYFSVTFTESGLQQSCWFWIFGCSLPRWSVTLDGNSQTSTSTSITFHNVNPGIHSYSIDVPSGYSLSNISGSPMPVNGNIQIPGGEDILLNFVRNQ